jgi:hypothetical protein
MGGSYGLESREATSAIIDNTVLAVFHDIA